MIVMSSSNTPKTLCQQIEQLSSNHWCELIVPPPQFCLITNHCVMLQWWVWYRSLNSCLTLDERHNALGKYFLLTTEVQVDFAELQEALKISRTNENRTVC